jgi:SAM-dependent methyltransferase
MGLNLPDKVRNYNDRKWLKLLVASIKKPVLKGIEFPRFPSDEIQTMFVGSANKQSLMEAFSFYQFFKKEASIALNPVSVQSRFLDFGCGWGRYLRFFWKDVGIYNLYGCDVDDEIVDLCHSLNVPGKIDKIERLGRFPYSDSFFDSVMAYSVFTHLPEKVHLHWVNELARVTRPGGIFILTLEPRRFMDFIADTPPSDNSWHQSLSAHKPNLPDYYREFDAGNLVFMPTNKGIEDFYGDAVVPLSYIEKNWSPHFEVINYLDDPDQFWQAVLVVRRTEIALVDR